MYFRKILKFMRSMFQLTSVIRFLRDKRWLYLTFQLWDLNFFNENFHRLNLCHLRHWSGRWLQVGLEFRRFPPRSLLLQASHPLRKWLSLLQTVTSSNCDADLSSSELVMDASHVTQLFEEWVLVFQKENLEVNLLYSVSGV